MGQIPAFLLHCRGGWIGIISTARGFLRADQNALGESKRSNPFQNSLQLLCKEHLLSDANKYSGIGTKGCMCAKQLLCLMSTQIL